MRRLVGVQPSNSILHSDWDGVDVALMLRGFDLSLIRHAVIRASDEPMLAIDRGYFQYINLRHLPCLTTVSFLVQTHSPGRPLVDRAWPQMGSDFEVASIDSPSGLLSLDDLVESVNSAPVEQDIQRPLPSRRLEVEYRVFEAREL